MHFIEAERLYLRGLDDQDVDGPYLQWMNDAQVTRYLESRFFPHSRSSLRSFIQDMSDGRNLLLGICLNEGDVHIGNIKLGPIDAVHRRAELGLLIGDKAQWGKGYASEAISAVTAYAFRELNLVKVAAGIYSTNLGSMKAFKKAGYFDEGHLKKHFFSDGQWVDHHLVARIRE